MVCKVLTIVRIRIKQIKLLTPITIPKHEPVKKVYVEMVRRIVESEAKNGEDTE